MAKDTSNIQHAMESISSNIRTFLRPSEQKLGDDMFQIAFLQGFFEDWLTAMEDGATNDEGYDTAVEQNTKTDDPNTPFDESVTEDDIHEYAEKLFGKPLSEVNTEDVDALQNNISALKEQVKVFFAKKQLMKYMIEAEERRLKNFQAILKSQNVDAGE